LIEISCQAWAAFNRAATKKPKKSAGFKKCETDKKVQHGTPHSMQMQGSFWSSAIRVMHAPGQYPQQVEIDNNLKALQEAVGGTIAAVYPFADQKGFRLMEKLLVLLRQFWGQGCKILLAQSHH